MLPKGRTTWLNATLATGTAFSLLGCVPNLFDKSDEGMDLRIEIPPGHSRVLAKGSVFELSPQVALCYGPPSDCQAKEGPLLSARIEGEAAELLTANSNPTFPFADSDSLRVFSRSEGDAVLEVTGELEDGTRVEKDINLLVRRANRFRVDAQCDSFTSADMVFLGGRPTILRQTFFRDERVLEGEHPDALVAEDLTRAPEGFLHDWFDFSPPEGTRLMEFHSALVDDFVVKAQIYQVNQLRVTDMRISDPDRIRSPNQAVSINADGFVDGRKACTLPELEATVLTRDVCGDYDKVTFTSGLHANIAVFKSGTCELEFTDSRGVQRFAFDVRVQAP